jgi:lipopolysaccharide transport system ATP-binding protein
MPIIEVSHLTKEYQLGHITSLKENVLNTFRRLGGKPIQKREDFKALDDVNFTIEEGEVVGIIGHNGAGKSTLLKHLANISQPTKGKVIVRGSVAPLIEVGAGVNPELTGRENIFLNGAILGIPKKIIQQKLDEIIDFSELEQFIDTPVKRYSSGMTVKLGFSIATSMEADILIIDEVLAVGDLAFQKKCYDRMETLIYDNNTTVLIVGHNVRQLERMCNRMILMEAGRVKLDGDPNTICNEYYRYTDTKVELQSPNNSSNLIVPENATGDIEILAIDFFTDSSSSPTVKVKMHRPFKIRVHLRAKTDLKYAEISIGIHTTDFVYITKTNSTMLSRLPNLNKGEHIIECSIDNLLLNPSSYGVGMTISDTHQNCLWYKKNINNFQVIFGDIASTRLPIHPALVYIPFVWNIPSADIYEEASQYYKKIISPNQHS